MHWIIKPMLNKLSYIEKARGDLGESPKEKTAGGSRVGDRTPIKIAENFRYWTKFWFFVEYSMNFQCWQNISQAKFSIRDRDFLSLEKRNNVYLFSAIFPSKALVVLMIQMAKGWYTETHADATTGMVWSRFGATADTIIAIPQRSDFLAANTHTKFIKSKRARKYAERSI